MDFLNPVLLGLDDPGSGELDGHNASAVAIPHEPSQAAIRHPSRIASGQSRRRDQGHRVDPPDAAATDGKLFGRLAALSFLDHVVRSGLADREGGEGPGILPPQRAAARALRRAGAAGPHPGPARRPDHRRSGHGGQHHAAHPQVPRGGHPLFRNQRSFPLRLPPGLRQGLADQQSVEISRAGARRLGNRRLAGRGDVAR